MTQETISTSNSKSGHARTKNRVEGKAHHSFSMGLTKGNLARLNRRNKFKYVPPLSTEETTKIEEIKPILNQKGNMTVHFRKGFIHTEKKSSLGKKFGKPKNVILDIETSPQPNTQSSTTEEENDLSSSPEQDKNTNVKETSSSVLLTFTKGKSKINNKIKTLRRKIEIDVEDEKEQEDKEEMERLIQAAELKNKGNGLYVGGNMGDALEVYKQAIAILEKCQKVHCGQLMAILMANVGSVMMALGYPDKSLEFYNLAFEYDPMHIKGKIRKSNVLICLGEYDQALEFLSETLNEIEESHSLYEYINVKIKEIKKIKSDFEELEISHKELLSNYEDKKARTFIMKLKDILDNQKYNQKAWSLLCTSCLSFNLLDMGLSNIDMMKSSLINLRTFDEHHLNSWCLWLHVQFTWQNNNLEGAIEILKKLKGKMEEEGSKEIRNCHCPFDLRVGIQDVETCLRIQEAIKLKDQGNAYIKQNSFKNAESAYTEAIDIITGASGSPIKFISILFSNRGLARSKLGQINLAMADYYKAIAIDPSYEKANLRLLDLLIQHNCSEQALQILEEFKLNMKNDNNEILARKEKEITRLSSRDRMIDYYKIMDLDKMCSKADIKKSYKKLALKCHPDKAKSGLGLVGKCSKVGYVILEHDEIEKRVIKNADTLFRMLNEANEVLNDDVKRSKLDGQQKFGSKEEERNFDRDDFFYEFNPSPESFRNNFYSRNRSHSFFGKNPFRHFYEC